LTVKYYAAADDVNSSFSRFTRRDPGVSIAAIAVRIERERTGMAPATTLQGICEMTRYLLSVYQPDGGVPPPEVLKKVQRELGALRDEMKAAGVWVFAAGLHPPGTATVLRLQDGDILTIDGPFAEGKEHIGGFTIIDAPDLDAALDWGRKLARVTTLPIEVRPFRGEGER
jgi:hypothetical protein